MRATSSLPTPVSPSISTGMVLLAALAQSVMTRAMLGAVAIMSLREKVPALRACSARMAASSASSFMALRREMMRRSGATGLTK
ncbi:hypothetical protein D3C86_2010890 [compost metagenome]